jgi:hypothetical protein
MLPESLILSQLSTALIFNQMSTPTTKLHSLGTRLGKSLPDAHLGREKEQCSFHQFRCRLSGNVTLGKLYT